MKKISRRRILALSMPAALGAISIMTGHAVAGIWTAEARETCKILGARPEFIGQMDGNTEITSDRYGDMVSLLKREMPDIIVTHWPIDSHRDHRICSVLAYDAWFGLGRNAVFYYFEVMSGLQTQNFTPTEYVDIATVMTQKHQACFVHRSQNIEATYGDDHGKMEVFRGMESGCQYAEAYIRHVQSPAPFLQIHP